MTITTGNRSLLTILLSALVQGGALYGLHHGLTNHHWPAPSVPLTIGLYTCVVLIPLTVQLLAEHAQRKVLWLLIAALTLAFFYFGWHFGSTNDTPLSQGYTAGESLFLFALELIVLWLLTLPFLQSRLVLGHWRVDYPALFTFAWRNKIMLLEAAAFTGLFWLLLALWQALFHMLQIDFFRDLFQEPIFVYPATAVVFGIAMHLIGAIEQLVSAVLEQILNVLKWLATVAGVLLTLFTLALLLKLPGLVFEGQKAISATWLLWLIAVVVLFLNAAYRDGTLAQPYPRWIGQALRFVVPLTVVIALTASYSLLIRAHHYGLTVQRFWAFVVAAAVLLYAVGYSASALIKGAWLARMAQVNVGVALALIATIVVALTPLASPYRLSANSQYQRILDNRTEDETSASASIPEKSAVQYLRWNAGNYGRERLEQLSRLNHHPNAERIRALAVTLMHAKYPWEPSSSVDAKSGGATVPEPGAVPGQANRPAVTSEQQPHARMVGVWQPPAGLKQIPIWPNRAPDMADVSQPAESVEVAETPNATEGHTSETVFDVTSPAMTVFPPKGTNTGAAIIVFPGGGFKALAITGEGTEICDWLTSKGITCVVSKYRVPNSDHYWDGDCHCHITPKIPRALQDAQRTIKLVRARAKELNVDPNKIGVIGFSAGGYLVAQTSNIFTPTYQPVDAADELSSRPDFAVAVYPGHLCRSGATLDPGIHVTKQTPPTFLLQAWDDPVDEICNSTVYARALDNAGVPAEVHLFAKGGHAFALRSKAHPVAGWPLLVENWLKDMGVLPR